MTYITALVIFSLCFFGMAIGLFVSKKVLRKGCSADPTDPNATCACKAKEEKIDNSDGLLNHTRFLNKS